MQKNSPFMQSISKAQVKFIRSLQQKKFRDQEGLFVAEGGKCVEELSRGFEPVQIVLQQGLSCSFPADVAVFSATPTEIEQMSSLRTPQGILGVFRKRPNHSPDSAVTNDLVLVLDGIQDPGNLGTIIRTCDWFGIRSILCSRETADCYNPKVVQATMGALARVQIYYVSLTDWLSRLQNAGKPQLPVYGTLLDGKNIYEQTLSQRKGLIIMGNEGNGISPEVRKFITHPLYIPSYSDSVPDSSEVIESLNVSIATAIVLAEFRRPR